MCAFGELWWIFLAVVVLATLVLVFAPPDSTELCDDNGMFWGLKSDSLVDYKVIAWKEITGRDYEELALAYQRQGTVE